MQGHKHRSPGCRCYWYQEHASSKNKLLIEGDKNPLVKYYTNHHDSALYTKPAKKKVIGCFFMLFTCRQYSITAARPNQLCRLYMFGILAALWKSKTATKDITAKTRASKFKPAWMNFIISLLHFQVQGSL